MALGAAAVANYNATWGMLGLALGAWAWIRRMRTRTGRSARSSTGAASTSAAAFQVSDCRFSGPSLIALATAAIGERAAGPELLPTARRDVRQIAEQGTGAALRSAAR